MVERTTVAAAGGTGAAFADMDGAAVIDEATSGSYDDVPEVGVHVILAVPLLAPRPPTPPPALPSTLPAAREPVGRAPTAPGRRRAQHARRRRSVVAETLVLGVTAAVVVLASVVFLLALVDWLD